MYISNDHKNLGYDPKKKTTYGKRCVLAAYIVTCVGACPLYLIENV